MHRLERTPTQSGGLATHPGCHSRDGMLAQGRIRLLLAPIRRTVAPIKAVAQPTAGTAADATTVGRIAEIRCREEPNGNDARTVVAPLASAQSLYGCATASRDLTITHASFLCHDRRYPRCSVNSVISSAIHCAVQLQCIQRSCRPLRRAVRGRWRAS